MGKQTRSPLYRTLSFNGSISQTTTPRSGAAKSKLSKARAAIIQNFLLSGIPNSFPQSIIYIAIESASTRQDPENLQREHHDTAVVRVQTHTRQLPYYSVLIVKVRGCSVMEPGCLVLPGLCPRY